MRFGGRQLVRAGWRLGGALACCIARAGPAAGGSYPETALSIALSTPPELVDEASLLFQLPSRAGISSTRLFAFNTNPYAYFYSSDTSSLGIVGQTRGQGLFVLVQPSFLLEGKPAFQAGWGGAWGTLRLGVAARAATSESEYFRYQSYIYSGTSTTNVNRNHNEQQHWEAALGVGLGGERFAVDVAADLQRLDEQFAQFASYTDTLTLDLEDDNDASVGVSARLQAHRGDVEVTGAGGWSRADGDVVGEYSDSGSSDSVALSRMFENWFGGIGLRFPAAEIDEVGIALHWSHRETASAVPGSAKSISAIRQLAISMQEQPWRALRFQAGVSLHYEEKGFEQNFDPGYQETWYTNSTTVLRAVFGWGVSYSWKSFEGRAALRDTLPLQDLFAAVDFFVRL